ncbi:MAG TPA: MerR family transcriptional regulator [Candidatus Limnocylindrales bacterium]|jgi:DNA-binding transcriptional MerR regulator
MYTIGEAAARSGLGIAALRAWERRYGIVHPVRTPAGYRLYDEEAIARLRLMRELVGAGWRPRQAAEYVAALRSPLETPAIDVVPGESALSGELVAAARDLDIARIEHVLTEALSRAPFEAAVESVLAPGLRDVGAAWADGRLDVAGEHAVSHAVLRRLAAIYDASGRPDARPNMLVGLPPGARHELGTLAFAIAARRAGIRTLYVGPDTPTESWRTALRESRAHLVAIGVPTEDDVRPAREVLTATRDAVPGRLAMIGGQAARGADRAAGAVVADGGLADAASLALQLLGRSTPGVDV